LLKAKVISLEISGMKKDSIINEKKNDLELLKVDYEEVKEKLNTVEKEKDKKEEALDIAMGKLNSLEDDKADLQKRLMIYSSTIKKQLKDLKSNSGKDDDEETDEGSNKVKELKKTLKEKKQETIRGRIKSKTTG
jgi:chromosome segregation ATPase